ncbi:MAG: HisA/HisF-related TIM barrel protein, partial [Betaproteobacteria bacterium]
VGAQAGPDLALFARLHALAPDRHWIGAGGVGHADDLRAAALAGASAWLVASALHDGGLHPG